MVRRFSILYIKCGKSIFILVKYHNIGQNSVTNAKMYSRIICLIIGFQNIIGHSKKVVIFIVLFYKGDDKINFLKKLEPTNTSYTAKR